MANVRPSLFISVLAGVAAAAPACGSSDAYLDPNEPVFGVISNGEARAYPLRIMAQAVGAVAA